MVNDSSQHPSLSTKWEQVLHVSLSVTEISDGDWTFKALYSRSCMSRGNGEGCKQQTDTLSFHVGFEVWLQKVILPQRNALCNHLPWREHGLPRTLQ